MKWNIHRLILEPDASENRDSVIVVLTEDESGEEKVYNLNTCPTYIRNAFWAAANSMNIIFNWHDARKNGRQL